MRWINRAKSEKATFLLKIHTVLGELNMRDKTGRFTKMREDITGQKFNHLTAIDFSHKNKNRKTYWNFLCDCGNIKTLRTDSVKSGQIQSCGCLKKEQDKVNLNRKGSKPLYGDIGKLSNCALYSRWKNMKRRCYDKNYKQYKDYGGRGIQVCNEWLYSFRNFYDWAVNNGFDESLQIDRIDNDGNYEPDNCRFVTPKENANNRIRKHADSEVIN